MKKYVLFLACLLSLLGAPEKLSAQNGLVVLQTDFGVKDAAVAAMKGVIMQVDPSLKIFDLTHEIPAYNIWEAALRLQQAAAYWPKGTVFVSVVDPGVGTPRKSVVLETRNDYYFVSPDNGTLTLIAKKMGIKEMREIDVSVHRLPGSEKSYTFHGRDIFAYTAAKLASRKIRFNEVGKRLPPSVVTFPYQPAVWENDTIKGNIDILDIQYGNVWSNIDASLLQQAGINHNDSLQVHIYQNDQLHYKGKIPYVTSFGEVAPLQPLCYLNSQLQLALALNQGNFAEKFIIGSGPTWKLMLIKLKPGN